MQVSGLDGNRYDVIVCGGGSAGVAAAWASAKAGAETILLERLGFCGGTPVAAMIHTLDAVHSFTDASMPVVAGFVEALQTELCRIDGMATRDNPKEAFVVHPEMMKIALDRLLTQSGVEVVHHAMVIDSLARGRVLNGVEVALVDGRARFHAGCVVDATGNADVAFHAGAEWVQDTELQALTYHFRLGNVGSGFSWKQYEEICRTALGKATELDGASYGGPWVIRLTEGEISLNATRICRNPTDPKDRTAAEQEGREAMLAIWSVLRGSVPPLRDSYIICGPTDLHIRESRKVVGDYILTEEDIASRRQFPDAIGLGGWPVDIHPTDGSVGVHAYSEHILEPYEIPYRCLLPKSVDGLLIAGRPISTTHRAHGSTRVPGTSFATGQAAGVAAALAARRGGAPRAVDAAEVRTVLEQQGALLSIGSLAR